MKLTPFSLIGDGSWAMIKSSRTYSALFLLLAYVTLLLGQLTPLATGSAAVTHAMSGECSGNCAIDGCSLTSQANKTCCCWQKKQAHQTTAPAVKTEQCALQSTASPVSGKTSCCGTTEPPQTVAAVDTAPADESAAETVYKCGCPCDDNKEFAQWSGAKIDLIPYSYANCLTERSYCSYPPRDHQRLTSRYSDPPDPPPKLSTFA